MDVFGLELLAPQTLTEILYAKLGSPSDTGVGERIALRRTLPHYEVRDATMCEWDALQPDGQALLCHCDGCQS